MTKENDDNDDFEPWDAIEAKSMGRACAALIGDGDSLTFRRFMDGLLESKLITPDCIRLVLTHINAISIL